MDTRLKGESMKVNGDQGHREQIQIQARGRSVCRSPDVSFANAAPRRLPDLPHSKEDASIALIAGILSEMTALLSDEASKNLINST